MAMNLGDEQLREVSSSRAELIHSSSQRSIAASDDFYSLSERGVSPASSDEATTILQHNSPQAPRYPVSPLLPSREPSPPRQQHPPPSENPSEVFYMSRSTPSPSPARPTGGPQTAGVVNTRTVANNAARYSDPDEPQTPRTEVASDAGSGTATPRPATIVRVTSGSTRPSTQQTVVQSDYPAPLQPSSAAFRHADNRAPQRNDPVFPTSFDANPPRLADSLGLHIEREEQGGDTQGQPRSFGTAAAVPSPLGGHPPAGNTSVATPINNSRTQSWNWQTTRGGNPVPTPGVDPTPALHFAIEQLTRDEEVRGYGRDSFIEPVTATQPRQSQPRQSNLTAPVDGGLRESYVPTGPSSRYSEQSEREVPTRASEGAAARPSGTSDTPFITEESRLAGEPGRPFALNRTSTVSHRYNPATEEEYETQSKLRAVPTALSYPSILGLVLLCIFMIITGVVASVRTARAGGLTRYDGTGTSLYFVFKYLPQLIAAVMIIWLHVIQDAIQRILPFVLLVPRTKRAREHDVLQTVRRYKSSYLLPDLSIFRDGELGVGTCNIVFWMTLFAVPLASTVFSPVYFVESDTTAYWRWGAVQGVCWTLLVLYFLLTIALIFVMFRFNLRDTTLRWDPRSLADLFVLLRRGNTTFSRYSADSGRLAGYPDTRPASIGLWRSPSSPNGFSHGIGIDNHIVGGMYSPPPLYTNEFGDPSSPAPISHFESWQTEHPDGYPWLPWFLRPSPAALWIATAIVLLIAFLVVSWVNRAVQVGFNPLLFAGRRSGFNFSSANFLYGFLPALLGMLCYLFWQPIDAAYRALQPFVNMQKQDTERLEGGASAEMSVLLDYNARGPFSVTFAALRNRHFRVAWFSFVTPLSLVLPVLAGGVFQAQYVVGTADTIHEIASLPGYIALCVFAIIYALSYLLIWPSRAHRQPHDIATVADVADYVIGGRMLNDITWKDPETKTLLVTSLVGGRRLTGEKRREGMGNFRFGQHLGLDGKPRLGVYRSA